MKNILGFIPASGRGTRMNDALIIKELLPVYISPPSSPILLFENSLISMKQAGVHNLICTVSEHKTDFIKYFNIASQKYNMSVAYVYQDIDINEYGVPCAIFNAISFLRGNTIIMRFPDTIIMPENCIERLLDFHYEKRSILTLGIFDTNHPERLGPVSLSENGKVINIQDKPQYPCEKNTWNCVIWEDDFLDLINEMVIESRSAENRKELIIFDAFKKCLEMKMPVYGMKINNGVCIDIASVSDFVQLWSNTNM